MAKVYDALKRVEEERKQQGSAPAQLSPSIRAAEAGSDQASLAAGGEYRSDPPAWPHGSGNRGLGASTRAEAVWSERLADLLRRLDEVDGRIRAVAADIEDSRAHSGAKLEALRDEFASRLARLRDAFEQHGSAIERETRARLTALESRLQESQRRQSTRTYLLFAGLAALVLFLFAL